MADIIPWLAALNNATEPRESGTLFLQTTVARDVTMSVSVTGSPTFSIDLRGSIPTANGDHWVTLATLTAPGAVTVSEHWFPEFEVNLTAFSGTGSVSAAIAVGNV
jgi:hypothetical protein